MPLTLPKRWIQEDPKELKHGAKEAMEANVSGYEQYQRLSIQLNNALEARGRAVLQPSIAEVSVRQFKDLFTRDVSERLKDLSALLRMAGRHKEPLSLTMARAVYTGGLQDTLCSILGRLQWQSFCNEPELVAAKERGCMIAECALDCVFEALYCYKQVQPPAVVATAKSEVFDRYISSSVYGGCAQRSGCMGS